MSYTIGHMSSGSPPWTLERFVLDSGESPVRTFLEGLDGRDRVDALALLKLLAEQGNGLKMPHSTSVDTQNRPLCSAQHNGR
jgi:hypothetical protein